MQCEETVFTQNRDTWNEQEGGIGTLLSGEVDRRMSAPANSESQTGVLYDAYLSEKAYHARRQRASGGLIVGASPHIIGT